MLALRPMTSLTLQIQIQALYSLTSHQDVFLTPKPDSLAVRVKKPASAVMLFI